MEVPHQIVIGTRASTLACVQATLIQDAIHNQFPQIKTRLKTIKTQGDRILDVALNKIGDKGLFIKELEHALLAGEIDIAVHSMKDMPGEIADDFVLHSALQRDKPHDVLLFADSAVTKRAREKNSQSLADLLPAGAIIGTSSLRREAQLKRQYPEFQCQLIRGNLQTRYKKLIHPTQGAHFDAIMLAAAGVHRLGWDDYIGYNFNPVANCIPSACQGILAVQYLANRKKQLANVLDGLKHAETELFQQAERAFLQAMAGGCQLPMGAHCFYDASLKQYQLLGIVLSPDGQQAVRHQCAVSENNPAQAGFELAEMLKNKGATAIL
ncbi:MAG: hydroxymethylbilane synthase [Cyanobacteria bacterium P01_H01_bin.74]